MTTFLMAMWWTNTMMVCQIQKRKEMTQVEQETIQLKQDAMDEAMLRTFILNPKPVYDNSSNS